MRELLASMEDEVVSVDLDRSFDGFRHSELAKNPETKKSEHGYGVPQDDETDVLKNYSPVITENTIDLTVSSTHTLDNAI